MIEEEDWISNKGRELLRKGKRAISQSRYLAFNDERLEEAESIGREALKTLRSAMNWLEDTDDFQVAHVVIDNAGRFIRETFGCQFVYEDDRYFNICPVSLSHNRTGFSPGYVVRSVECSICRLDPENCEHITGRVYGQETCHRIVTAGEILEVSIVARPRTPDARIEKMSISMQDLERRLPPGWRPGIPVNCDFCLTPCQGIADPFLSDPTLSKHEKTVSPARDVENFSAVIAIETRSKQGAGSQS